MIKEEISKFRFSDPVTLKNSVVCPLCHGKTLLSQVWTYNEDCDYCDEDGEILEIIL